MKVEIRSDRVHISGYVNAVDRWSRPLTDKEGKRFVEKIVPGTFRRALEEAEKVDVMLNHDRVLTDTRSGNVTLEEDSIGLHFDGDIYDPSVIESARKRELRGWSFGFSSPHEQKREDADEPGADYKRTVDGLKLLEVSIIDKRKLPAYPATSVEVRATEDGGEIFVRMEADGEIETEDRALEEKNRLYQLRERLRLKK
ncbi:MAG: HK97 family phage prohead protease [Clostridia bacterium]|nr:HK97 family phage prohead protease [Clostridia bacterium]